MKYFTYAQAEKESEIYVLPSKTKGIRMEFFMQVFEKKFPHEGTLFLPSFSHQPYAFDNCQKSTHKLARKTKCCFPFIRLTKKGGGINLVYKM